jgi:hypothetical protein
MARTCKWVLTWQLQLYLVQMPIRKQQQQQQQQYLLAVKLVLMLRLLSVLQTLPLLHLLMLRLLPQQLHFLLRVMLGGCWGLMKVQLQDPLVAAAAAAGCH